MAYRGRFAPSPTGPLHFGSLIAAVASYVDARAHGGEWLVRIEDLDLPRVVPGTADDILRTLAAFGLHWDANVVAQSTRSAAYHAALHELRRQGRVYACACSRREIADSGLAGIEGYVYPGTCRSGLPAGRIARAWRVDTRGAIVGFEDAIQAPLEHELEKHVGDFVIYRSDSVYAYQLAVCVDDAEQGITHVVRGADLIQSTTRQIWLQRLLGVPTPLYAHCPVAVDMNGEKLSKQTRAKPITPHRATALLVAALRFLGQSAPAGLERESVDAVLGWAIENWSLEAVPRVATRAIASDHL